MLERRGVPGATAELDRRAIEEAGRQALKRHSEAQAARFNPLSATGPAGTFDTRHKSPSQSRRAARRALEAVAL